MIPNLNYLEKQWLDKTGAARAFAHKRRRSAAELKALLCHHDEEAVEYPDTEYRDDFDKLLMFYSLTEIAITISFVPSELPTTFKKKHLAMLADPAVRQFYEWNYPQDLPRRLRERLQTGLGHVVPSSRRLTACFYEFLDLTKLIERDNDLQAFLWALDGGASEDGIDITDIRKATKTPERMLRAVLKRTDKRTALDNALNGFSKFIVFCETFQRLLTRCENRLFAETMWLAHAYWFWRFGYEIGGDLRSVFRTIASWEVPTRDKRLFDKRVKELGRTISLLSIPPLSHKPLDVEACQPTRLAQSSAAIELPSVSSVPVLKKGNLGRVFKLAILNKVLV